MCARTFLNMDNARNLAVLKRFRNLVEEDDCFRNYVGECGLLRLSLWTTNRLATRTDRVNNRADFIGKFI